MLFRSAIEALNLFRTLDRPEMAVAAMYVCCQLDPGTVARGTTRADGTREGLGADDLEVCLRMRRELDRLDVVVLLRFAAPFAAPAGCVSPPGMCADILEDRLLGQIRASPETFMDGDPLSGGLREQSGWYTCHVCAEVLRARVVELQREVWRELPEMMDLELADWDAAV